MTALFMCGYYIPMSVIVALFLTISLKLPDSNTSSTKRKITLFPIYRSSSHRVHPHVSIGIVQKTGAKIGNKFESSKKKHKKLRSSWLRSICKTTRIKSGRPMSYVLIMSLCHHTQYGLVSYKLPLVPIISERKLSKLITLTFGKVMSLSALK